MEYLLKTITFLPLLSFFYAKIASSFKVKRRIIAITCSLFLAVSAVIMGAIWFKMESKQIYEVFLWKWISFFDFSANLSLYFDKLSVTMVAMVLSVASLVHIYSIEYMESDEEQGKFMAYISLFTFFMLILLSSANFMQLFLGWEGVGLCSYLLISFYSQRQKAVESALKAFLVNRFADGAMLVGIALLFLLFQSFDFPLLSSDLHAKFLLFNDNQRIVLFFACVCLFIGCMAKSAQFGLHIWLPDAMEAPTPVSALIHAATMVTAGVFLLARLSPILESFPVLLHTIALIGGITAISAAFTAIFQQDIKKIIAYSTCSQLGYMFMACGASAYNAALFHLLTHAFFKALLFLGAGSVIHGLEGEQNIGKMGGLSRYMPWTCAAFLLGSLALIGIYPFAGYFSKDFILEIMYFKKNTLFWPCVTGFFAVFLTAIYSSKLFVAAFLPRNRVAGEVAEMASVPHESHREMRLVLLLLGLMTIFVPFLLLRDWIISEDSAVFWGESLYMSNYVEFVRELEHYMEKNGHFIKLLPSFLAFSGIIYILSHYIWRKYRNNLASSRVLLYGRTPVNQLNNASISLFAKPLYNFMANGYYIDKVYRKISVGIAMKSGIFFSEVVDKSFLNAFFAIFANVTRIFSNIASFAHKGNLYGYILLFFSCIAAILYYILIKI